MSTYLSVNGANTGKSIKHYELGSIFYHHQFLFRLIYSRFFGSTPFVSRVE